MNVSVSCTVFCTLEAINVQPFCIFPILYLKTVLNPLIKVVGYYVYNLIKKPFGTLPV
jgi:hypothetical protein